MGLGYALAGNLEAATEFLKNVAGLLLSLSALAVSTAIGLGAVTSMGSPIETGDDPQSGRTHR
jgi:hypothetical protein